MEKAEQLSANFKRGEFERSGPMPDECLDIFRHLCQWILEPIRTQFDQPLEVTSGDRREAANDACNGNLHSEHVATPRYCAADWKIAAWRDLRGVFDWIRLNSGLPFHHVTLEHAGDHDVIHISVNLDASGVRIAKEGKTENAGEYIDWSVA